VWNGEEIYWEHLGRLDKADYRRKWKDKEAWYSGNFPGKLKTTSEGGDLSEQADRVIRSIQGI
jgi:hypothetical protein